LDAYTRYAPALLRKAERVVRSRADAQDLVHGLFVDLLNTPQTPRDLAYLYVAINRRCLSFLRDEKNRARLLAESENAVVPQTAARPDEATLARDTLLKLIPLLTAAEAETMIFYYLDELGQEELAALCCVSRKTIQRQLERIQLAASSLESSLAGVLAKPEFPS
jgi:RNA polymerase sigma factor (sigma-70 family)